MVLKTYINVKELNKQHKFVSIFCKLQSLDFKALNINADRFLRIICAFSFISKCFCFVLMAMFSNILVCNFFLNQCRKDITIKNMYSSNRIKTLLLQNTSNLNYEWEIFSTNRSAVYENHLFCAIMFVFFLKFRVNVKIAFEYYYYLITRRFLS